MKISNYRRVYEQDYQEEYQELIKQLGIPLNSSFDELYNALNNNLSFRDNLASTIATFSVAVDSSGVPINKTSFNLTANQKILEGVVAINATGVTNPTLLPSGGIFISFTKSQNTVIVNNIKGLITGENYSITVLAI